MLEEVRPHTGARIETIRCVLLALCNAFALIRGRGLKRNIVKNVQGKGEFALIRGRGLKRF